MHKRTHIIYAFLFLLSSTVVEVNGQELKYDISEVIIEGEAHTNAIARQKEALSSKIVISRKELNSFGHHTAGDVLKRMPRIFVQGPPTFNRNIMMAGLDKQFQCVLIDGNRPAGGEDYRDFKLDRFPVDMIEEIEIVYNPPVDYGGDASVGTINIKLKEAKEKKFISTNLALAGSSTYPGGNPELGVTFGNSIGKLSFIGSYSFNNFQRQNINAITNGDLIGTEEEVLDVAIHGFTTSLKYKLNKQSFLTYKAFVSDYSETQDFVANIKRRSQGGLNETADTANDKKVRRLHSHNISFVTQNEKWEWENSLSFGQHIDTKDRWRNQLKSSGQEITFEDEGQRNTETVFKSGFKYSFGIHSLKAGIRTSGFWRNYDRLSYLKSFGNMFWDEVTDGSYTLFEKRLGIYLSDEISLKKLSLVPALRSDYDYREYETIADTDNFDYISFNQSLHAKYQISKDVFIKADAANQLSRPPFNSQVPIDKIKHKKETIERGNKELKPSRSYNFSAGIEKYIGKDSYFALRGFYNTMRNVVEKKQVGIDEASGYRIIQSVNVDSGKVYGLDFDTRLSIIHNEQHTLSLNGNFSWLGSSVRDASTSQMRRLNEQPEWITNSSIDYLNTKRKVQVSLGFNYIASRYIAGGTDEGTIVNVLEYNPYSQFDARIKYFFKPKFSVYLNATNIFNEPLVITQGAVSETETVGRDVRLGLSMMF